MRWSAFSFSMYLTPKLSTMREKNMGVVLYFHSAGVLGTGAKPNLAKVSFESVVGDAAGLLEARHAFTDLEVDPDVGNERAEAVLLNYFVWDAG